MGENTPKEEDFLFDKKIECPICDHSFKIKVVKGSKLRRLLPEQDLRPRFMYIDTLKYDVYSCPYCGYTAMSRYFSQIAPVYRKMIKDGVCSKFKPASGNKDELPVKYEYEFAIDRYKLALYNTMVKNSAISEKSYTCLKIAWLYRGMIEEMLASGEAESSSKIKKAKKEEHTFYEQAYEGFVQAVASEMPPICGMDLNTVDLLIAAMAFRLEKYDIASKCVANILVSQTAGRNIKDKAYDLKEEIMQILHSEES